MFSTLGISLTVLLGAAAITAHGSIRSFEADGIQ